MKILIPILLLLLSCSDKYSSIVNSAPAPLLSFNTDTVKVREKDFTNINSGGYLWIKTIPSTKQFNVQYNDTSGKVHFMYRGVLLKDSWPVIVAGDSTGVFVSCDVPGIYSVDFYLTDQLGRTTSRQLIIQCMANQVVKTAMNIQFKDSSVVDNWVYQFDAGATKKSDGIITEFHFSVNGASVISSIPVIEWTFHSRGLQRIGLFVVDDLGQHSDTLTQTVIIP